MGRRNWCRVEWDEQTGALEFDIRVEKEKGGGVTAGYVGASVFCLKEGCAHGFFCFVLGDRYPMRVPPPGW
jgi:hypothetical protein